MRKLTLFAILLLFSGGLALAQSPQDMGNAPTPGATFVTGVVVSSASDHIIIRNDVGDLVTVFLVDSTVGAKDRAAGTRIKVNYHLEDARAIADEILGYQGDVPEPAVAPPPVVVTGSTPVVETPPPAAVIPPPPPAPAPVAEMPDPEPEPTPSYEAPAADEPAELPATASNLGLVGLLGLLALAAAVVIRVVR